MSYSPSCGGGSGIRTPVTLTSNSVFKTDAFDRSAKPPHAKNKNKHKDYQLIFSVFINMVNLPKILKRILGYRSYNVDGFVYNFISFKKMEDFANSVEIVCDVTLPNPSQSYVVEKFNQDVQVLIESAMDFISSRFSYRLQILVDGEDPPEVYVNSEKVFEIIKTIKEKYQIISFRKFDNPKDLTIFCEIEPFGPLFYQFDAGDTVSFNFGGNIKEIIYKGKNYDFDPKDLDDLSGWINLELLESSQYRFKAEDDLYDILQDQWKIQNNEIFINFNLIINKILGHTAHPNWTNKKKFFSS